MTDYTKAINRLSNKFIELELALGKMRLVDEQLVEPFFELALDTGHGMGGAVLAAKMGYETAQGAHNIFFDYFCESERLVGEMSELAHGLAGAFKQSEV